MQSDSSHSDITHQKDDSVICDSVNTPLFSHNVNGSSLKLMEDNVLDTPLSASIRGNETLNFNIECNRSLEHNELLDVDQSTTSPENFATLSAVTSAVGSITIATERDRESLNIKQPSEQQGADNMKMESDTEERDVALDMECTGQSHGHVDANRTLDLLPSATAEAMEQYVNLLSNQYLGQATGKSIAGEESMPCECRYDPEVDDPNAACGDDDHCINRMMFMECSENDCSCGRFCRNRRFQLRQYARVDVIKTEKKGYGLRALTDLPTNTFVMEYIGEVITYNEFIRRTNAYESEGITHFYFMTLRTDEIIDATKKGCLARFINHSCNPNSVTQKWVVNKKLRIGIFTQRPVKAGEELTFDYKFERYGAVAQKCYCGEANCKGFIGGAKEDEAEDDLTATQADASDDDGQAKKPVKKTRRRVPKPLTDLDQVQSFVKKMLDSVGKVHLVQKLLESLELTTTATSLGRDILKKFIRLHGLKMLKFWLGEWKHDQQVVFKVLSILHNLPLANRNGLEDSKLCDVVAKFKNHENQEIGNMAQTLLDKWAELKTVYRIPKRLKTEESEAVSSSENNVEQESITERRKKCRFRSTREFFDPDNDYYEYIVLDADYAEIYWRMQYPPVSVIPTAPRAHLRAAAKSAYLQQMKASNQTPFAMDGYRYADIDTTPYTTRMDPPRISDHRVQSATKLVTREVSRGVTPDAEIIRKLPPNWRWAMSEDGQIYYYNKITMKTQWDPPEEKASSIEGVGRHEIDGLVEEAMRQAQSKKQRDATHTRLGIISPAEQPSSRRTTPGSHHSSDVAPSTGLSDTVLKKEVGLIVTKYLSTKQKRLWSGDKALFKELARKITHHVVGKEANATRKTQSANDAMRRKIEKFIDIHGADIAKKLSKDKELHLAESNPLQNRKRPASPEHERDSRSAVAPTCRPSSNCYSHSASSSQQGDCN